MSAHEWNLSGLFQLLFHHLPEIFHIPVLNTPAVYENRRYASDLDLLPFFIVQVDFTQYRRILTVFVELRFVQPHFLSNISNFFVVKVSVVFKQFIMEFPEFALAPCSKGCCRRLYGEFMIAQGEILENNLYRFRVLLEQLLKFRVQPGTVRSLKIAENSDNHRCIPGAFERRIRRVDLHKKVQ